MFCCLHCLPWATLQPLLFDHPDDAAIAGTATCILTSIGRHRHPLRHPFDALDGRIARMTTRAATSEGAGFAGRRNTFGVAPAAGADLGIHFRPIPSRQRCIRTASCRDFICFLFLIAGFRGWRASTSATMPSRAIRAAGPQVFCGMPIPRSRSAGRQRHLCYGYPNRRGRLP